MRGVLEFQVDGPRKEGRLNLTWMKQVEEKSMKRGLTSEDVFYTQNCIVFISQYLLHG